MEQKYQWIEGKRIPAVSEWWDSCKSSLLAGHLGYDLVSK